MSRQFLDQFLSGDDKTAPLPSDPLPAEERDVLMLDPAAFDDVEPHPHDHSGDDKIGSCGNACNTCPSRGACDHEHE